MKRKSISLKNHKVIKYIETVSDKIKISETRFIEYIVEKNMKKDYLTKNLETKKVKERGLLNREIFTSKKEKIRFSELSISNSVNIPINGDCFFNSQNKINEPNLKKIIRNFIITNEVASNYFIKPEKTWSNLYIDKATPRNDLISITLIGIEEMKVIGNSNVEIEKLKELDVLYRDLKLQLAKKFNNRAETLKILDKEYLELEIKTNAILKESTFNINVEFDGWQLPLIIDDELNPQDNFYDYLNIQYKAFRDFKQARETDSKFIVLLKCNYGFFYCNIFDSPEDGDYFRANLNELKTNKKHRENTGNFIIDNNIIRFPPDYPAIKKESKLLKKIIRIKELKNKVIKNAGNPTFDVDKNL
ncbi:hypothetical protein [Providencia manganoxydans]|uniref:hypothetical protein n=1 Tax=Providencia manganoxydans TaxID=2923283 RepID=UPI0034E54024